MGHYIGVAPQNAELALDRAISKAGADDGSKLLITALHRRGAISGVLGQNMQLVDTRDPSRVIVLAGMGQPGGFRQPELTVLARELVWMLGRSARQHLQTVLIGSGAGNLPWPTPCARGFEASAERYKMPHPCTSRLSSHHLCRYFRDKFFAHSPCVGRSAGNFCSGRRSAGDRLLRTEKGVLASMEKAAESESREKGVRELRKALESGAPDCRVEPIRLTVRLQEDFFEFAALTEDASVPQRVTQINPQLIDEANNQLPEASDFAVQLNRGNLSRASFASPGSPRGGHAPLRAARGHC